MLKHEIVEVVTSELSRLGIKGCSMDYIASSLSISKKTIYEHFESKQNLLRECVNFCISKNIEQIQNYHLDTVSPLLAIARINGIILGHALNLCPAFHNDIRNSVELSKLMSSKYITYVNECYMAYFDNGIHEGLLMDNVNISHAMSFFGQQIRNMYEKRMSDTMAQIDSYWISILTYMAGICTDKGRSELERIRTEIL